jgi:hypothetical protein
MTQERTANGQFGKKIENDIRKKDVDKAIRFVVDDLNVGMTVRKPIHTDSNVDVNGSLDVFHHHDDQPFEDVFLKIALSMLALLGIVFIIYWMVRHP